MNYYFLFNTGVKMLFGKYTKTEKKPVRPVMLSFGPEAIPTKLKEIS
jgi:hypothetical protein